MESVAQCGGLWVCGGNDDTQYVVYLGCVLWGAHTYFLGGDYVHYFVLCHVLGKIGREWVGNRHVLFPACTEGKEDEEAKVTEGVTVFVFFLTEEGVGSDSFD